MNHPIFNHQGLIAEQVVLDDIQTSHACYEAFLKIKRWQFIIKIPGVAKRITKEADESIEKNFLSFVTNKFVLIEQDYFFSNTLN